MPTIVDLSDQEIADLKAFTKQAEPIAAVRSAMTEYLRLARRLQLKSLSGQVVMDDNWQALEAAELRKPNGDKTFDSSGGVGISERGQTTGFLLIQRNLIGTQIDGITPLPNSGPGIVAGQLATVGGLNSGDGNVIAFNGGDGVVVKTFNEPRVSLGVTILGNSIFSNVGLGIDLNDDGVTANDLAPTPDADTGPNNLQNFPVLNSVVSALGTTTIAGTLNGTPNTTFRIEFFVSTAADPSGFGEGQTSLGTMDVTTDINGGAAINFTHSTLTGNVVTTTATRTDGEGGLIETSEFSQAIILDVTSPTVTINQAAGQADPTSTSPIHFTVVFSEAVTNFATGDVTLAGTAGATTAIVTGSGTTYYLAVSGMTQNGTVIATIAVGKAHDAAGNPSAASTSTDNTITFTQEEQVGLPNCDISTANEIGSPGTASLQDDADNSGEIVLLVTGTTRNDVIIIEPRPSNQTQVRVKSTGKLLGIF